MNEILEKLAALDLSTFPREEVKHLITELQKIGIMQFTFHPGKTITRGRVNEGHSFTHANELSYKPQQFNTTYQRASTPNRTMLYGSVISEDLSPGDVAIERAIALPEVSSLLRNLHLHNNSAELEKEIITFGSWVVTDDIPLLAVCYHQSLSQNSSLGRKLLKESIIGVDGLPVILKANSIAANEFFANEFGKPSQLFKGHYEYMISAIFSEIAVDRGFAGVYFPSVQADGRGFNVAIAPDFADRCLRLDKVVECTLYKRDGQFILDNDAFCVVEPGSKDFKLQLIIDPTLHSTQEEISRQFDEMRGK